MIAGSKQKLLAGVLGMSLAIAPVAPALAQSEAQTASETEGAPAVATVENFYGTLLDVWQNGQKLGMQGRYDALKPAIQKAFDLDGITRLSVGPAWTKMTAEEHAKLVEAFTHMTVANYAKNFSDYSGQGLDVAPEARERGSYRVVETEIVRPNNEPVQLYYVMRDGSAGWQIADVLYDGKVSELTTRRSEFASVVKNQGAAGLVDKLNQIAKNALES